MQRIYEPENLMEGELLQGMLASEGIEAHLVGRDLIGGKTWQGREIAVPAKQGITSTHGATRLKK